MQTEFEYTDTFNGEANYSWARRASHNGDMPERAAIRAAKTWAGLNGVRCRKENYGDTIALFPSGSCTVLFISWRG